MLPEMNAKRGFILEGFLTSCTFNYLNREFESRAYMLILLGGGFIIPFVTIVLFNLLMFIRLRPNKLLYSHQSDTQVTRRHSKLKEIQNRLANTKKESICISDTGLDDITMLKNLEDRLNRTDTNNKTCSNFSVKSYLIRFYLNLN